MIGVASEILIPLLVLIIGLLHLLFLARAGRKLHQDRLALNGHKLNLEREVQKRTRSLRRANAQLQAEVAERRRVEQALRESEEQFRALAETSPLAIYVSEGIEQRSTYINPTFVRLFGYTMEEVPTVEEWWPLAYPDREWREQNVPEWQRRVAYAIETGTEIEPMEVVVTCRDGTHKVIRWGYKTIGRQNWAFGLDLTDLRQAEEALRQSEQKYRVLFQHSPDPFLILVEGVFVDCNQAAEQALGMNRDSILGKAPYEISPLYQPDGQQSVSEVHEKLQQALESSRHTFEWTHQRADGSLLLVEVSVISITWDGRPAFFIAWRDITERKHLERELQEQATTDALTGITNRRHVIELIRKEIHRARRHHHTFAVALIDLDYFKHINDTLGHTIGDQALLAFTRLCKRAIREVDLLARFGGDEFILLLPETTIRQAWDVLERVRSALAEQPFTGAETPSRVTISVGIASWLGDDDSLETLIERADRALYQAKAAGRNQIQIG